MASIEALSDLAPKTLYVNIGTCATHRMWGVRMSNTVQPLEAISAQDLLEMPLPSVPWIVEDLIGTGLNLLVGDPKIGKSWFVLQLALCVNKGLPFLDHATCETGVLYLCLEDTQKRIQERLFKLTDEAKTTLQFVTEAKTIHSGLFLQLDEHIAKQPNTKLIIIDTLQMVRGSNTQSKSYASDYSDISALKKFADKHEIAILVVHHTRKMDDQNVFNTISGSNGLMGASDTTLVLDKNKQSIGNATLSCKGRDIEFAEYQLAFQNCQWKLIKQTSAEELREREIPSCVLQVLDFVSSLPGNWEGTPTALLKEASIDDVKPNALPKYLNEHHLFLEERDILYARKRTPSARLITLQKIQKIEPFVEE